MARTKSAVHPEVRESSRLSVIDPDAETHSDADHHGIRHFSATFTSSMRHCGVCGIPSRSLAKAKLSVPIGPSLRDMEMFVRSEDEPADRHRLVDHAFGSVGSDLTRQNDALADSNPMARDR